MQNLPDDTLPTHSTATTYQQVAKEDLFCPKPESTHVGASVPQTHRVVVVRHVTTSPDVRFFVELDLEVENRKAAIRQINDRIT